MTILFMDGMDLYGVTADLSTRYAAVNGTNITYSATSGRFGGGGITVSDDDKYFNAPIAGTPQTAVISFGVFRTTVPSAADIVFRANNSGAGNINFRTIAALPDIQIRRGPTTILGSFSLSLNTFHWVSIKIKVANTGGTIDVEVDGVNVFSFTGDTLNSGTETNNSFDFGGDINQDFTYDDIIITDIAGSAPFNALLADRRIDTILPNATGDSAGFTASPVVDNFLNVDDTAPDGDTTHVEAEVAATKDLYNMASMGFSPSAIDAVNVVALSKNPDAGGTQYKLKVKSGVTEGTGSAITPTTGYQYDDEVFLTNPDTTAAWTESEVNSMQAGMEIV